MSLRARQRTRAAALASETTTENLNSAAEQSTSTDDNDSQDVDNCDKLTMMKQGVAESSTSTSELLSHRSRLMFIEGELEKLLEFGQQCSQIITDTVQTLLARFESQKDALEQLMKSEDHSGTTLPPLERAVASASSEFSAQDELTGVCEMPTGLTEDTTQFYLKKLSRLMEEFSRAVSQSSLRPAVEAATGARRTRRDGRRSRVREAAKPVRILEGVEALDIALVVNTEGRIRYRQEDGSLALFGIGQTEQLPETSWSPLPSQTLYCAVSYSRRIAVVDTNGRLLTSFSISDAGGSDTTGNFERVSYMRASTRLLVSDYHSLYICDLCGKAQSSLHKFGWIVGHCVDEAAGRLYIADRVNEYVSVYCLASLQELRGLVHSSFTDGLSSVCLLNQQLLVSDRGANRIFAFNADNLEPIYSVPLRCPLFLTTDFNCHIYVTVGGSGGGKNSVKILDNRGRLKRKLVPSGSQFGSPGGLSVSADAAELFVCDLDNMRIQVFRL